MALTGWETQKLKHLRCDQERHNKTAFQEKKVEACKEDTTTEKEKKNIWAKLIFFFFKYAVSITFVQK